MRRLVRGDIHHDHGFSGTLSDTAATASARNPEAMATLTKMAEFLSGTPRFRVNVRSGYDVVQETGQKIEFGERRKITVDRPDRLRLEATQSDGDQNLLLVDGREITLLSTPQNVYAKTAQPGNLDKAVVYFKQNLKMRLPLAALLVSTLPAELDRRVEAIEYVERTTLFGTPAHHLAARTASVDFQVWVAEGDRPLPLRIVLTYRDDAGQPQFWADFSDWDLGPTITDAVFAFTPPAGARQIQFLAQLQQAAARKPDTATPAAAPTGEQP